MHHTDKNHVIVVGTNDYHPESYYAPVVAAFIVAEGLVFWDDIYDHVEKNTIFTAADIALVCDQSTPRWKKVVYNLHSHRTLEGGWYGEIVRIAGGFAMRATVNELNIDVLSNNGQRPRNPGNHCPKYMKRLTGVIVNTAYTELGKPLLGDTRSTRSCVERMVKHAIGLSECEMVVRAKEIILNGVQK